MLAFQFDTTITLGNVVSMGTVLFAIFIAALKISIQIKDLQFKMNLIWTWYAKEHGIELNGERK